MSEWIPVSEYKDIPDGEWLVKVRDKDMGIRHHVTR